MASPASGVDFDHNRLSQGEMIAGIGGIVLFISMWMDWYGVKVKTALGTFGSALGGPNAWQSFSLIDIIIFLVALIAIGVAAMRALNSMPEMPYPPATLLTVAGAIALVLILFRLIVQPFDVPDGVDVTRKLGIWLGLLSAAAITYGGWRAMQESGATFPSGGASGTDASAAAAPTMPMAPTGGAEAAAEPATKEGPGAPQPGTSTGAPDAGETPPPPPPAAADPVPGETAGQTPPGIAGEPPGGEGTRPPGV